MKERGLDPKLTAPAYIRNKISNIKNEMLSSTDIAKFYNTPQDRVAEQVYYEYIDILKKNNTVDFDDLLRLPVQLFMDHPDVLEAYQDRYKYILIDEYQDTNEVQYKLSKLLAKKYKNIFIVGDPDQSIYMFRGANFRNILNFGKDYKNAKVIPLEENYRSTKYILDAANSVIKNNKDPAPIINNITAANIADLPLYLIPLFNPILIFFKNSNNDLKNVIYSGKANAIIILITLQASN